MIKIFKRLSIPQVIVLAYLLIILIGAVLLTLPFSAANGEWTSFIDALFTATSATAVTGQVTLNTAAHWNYIGKTIIITLIEIGGLGFMSIWILLYYFFRGQGPNLKQRMIVTESLSFSGEGSVQSKIWYIIRFALVAQFIGAFLLAFSFIPEYGLLKGLYFSVFHSISAFCNAGFDLFGTSLINYQENSFVLLVIAGLIMAGGLGFIVWEDLLKYPRRRTLKRYTKIVLMTTIFLWVASALYFWLMERDQQTFAHLSAGDQLSNYIFLAVTPRTAGYVNVNYATLSEGSIFLTFVLMFIGASSASTGGGIKVSTFAVLLIVIYRYIHNQQSIIFKRNLSSTIVKRSFFIFTSGMTIAVLATLVLFLTETLPEAAGFEFILMEVFSTLGTVGLTMGMTPLLTAVGKFILILLMLIGRVGVLTFLWSLAGEKRESRIHYPDVDMIVG